MTAPRLLQPSAPAHGRYIDLSGQAMYVFRFAAEADLAYEYFCDIPAVFRLLPDALDVRAYGPDSYRLVVGASDGHGHSMAAVFDLQAYHEPGYAIRIMPAENSPPIKLPGLAFPGALAAEAIFRPHPGGTTVEYCVEIEMSIPVPGVLRLMPLPFLQRLGETAMEIKMSQMINGFTRGICADFEAWANG